MPKVGDTRAADRAAGAGAPRASTTLSAWQRRPWPYSSVDTGRPPMTSCSSDVTSSWIQINSVPAVAPA